MSPSRAFTSPLGSVIGRFLALKQSLGCGYQLERRILQSLDTFLSGAPCGPSDLTPEAFDLWSRDLKRLTPSVRRNHMRVVRNLCLYRQRGEPQCYVPDKCLFPAPHQPQLPFIFSARQIARLLGRARDLKAAPCSPLRPEVFRLAVVLLFTAGLRRGELVRLTLGDCQTRQRTLLIRASKFHKSRLVPLSTDAAREVESYLCKRQLHGRPVSDDSPLLWHGYGQGRGYTGAGLGQGLRGLFRAAGILKPDGRPPRTHDLRHSFAVNSLLRWYRDGVDVQAKLPLLAAFMGHVSVASTEYYLRFNAQVAANASARFEKCFGKLVTPKPEPTGERP